MSTINNTFINAFLADATYVHGLTAGLSQGPLKAKLAERMTSELADYISSNFSVVTSDAALPVSSEQIRVVSGDVVPVNTTVSPSTGEVFYTGSATMEAPGNSDALTVYNTSSSIKKIEIYGLDGNDALIGDAAQNFIDGGTGDDLIAGGVGLNTLIGGEGNDIILTHVTPGISGRRGPDDSWIAPEDARTVLAQGATWGVYEDAQGVMHVSTNNTRYDPQAQAGTPEASKAIGLSSVTREQLNSYQKNSKLHNRYMGYRSICCVRKAISSGCMPSLAQSLQRATRKAVLQ